MKTRGIMIVLVMSLALSAHLVAAEGKTAQLQLFIARALRLSSKIFPVLTSGLPQMREVIIRLFIGAYADCRTLVQA